MIMLGNGSYMSHNDQLYPDDGGVEKSRCFYNTGCENSELPNKSYTGGIYQYGNDDYSSDEDENEHDDDEYTGKEDNIFKWTIDALLGTRFQKDKNDKVDNRKKKTDAKSKNQVGTNWSFMHSNENDEKISAFSKSLLQPQNDNMNNDADSKYKMDDEITNTFNLKNNYNTDTLNFKPLRSAKKFHAAPEYARNGLRSSEDLFRDNIDHEKFNQYKGTNANTIPGGFNFNLHRVSPKESVNPTRQFIDDASPRRRGYEEKNKVPKPTSSIKPGKSQDTIMAELDTNNAKLSRILETREAQEQHQRVQEQSYKNKYTKLKRSYKNLLTNYRDLSEVAIQEIQKLKRENDMLRQQLNR
ncbi:hypothetical protein ACO0QE_003723 [Hanseniaspora vineae]